MKDFKNDLANQTSFAAGGIARLFGSRFGARIALEPDTGAGAGGTGGEGGSGEGGGQGGSGEHGSEGNQGGSGKGNEGNGGNKPTDREAELLKDVMSKKKRLGTVETELAQANARLKEFDGIDPNAVRELLTKQKEAEKTAAEAKGDFERVKKMMADEHAVELKSVKDALAAKDSETAKLLGTINNLTIGQSFATSSFVNEELVLTPNKARVIYGDFFEVEGDAAVAYDKPKGAGERTKLVDGSGNPLAFDAAIRKLVEADPDRERIVKSKMQPGAGSRTTETRSTSGQGDQSKLTGLARIQASLTSGKAFSKK